MPQDTPDNELLANLRSARATHALRIAEQKVAKDAFEAAQRAVSEANDRVFEAWTALDAATGAPA